ncbi:MAG: hypothetical protein NXY57DRAFT_268954 [Lentinula lateritia]|uniref:Uncharacterized protein n=1 Tax=Lentinula lateritia TaxID=40482 RepID=A0ABQ8VQE1_9AGAR|nr:MAG: hypothetical protein NXY57DRAFT_268954 [Lentinula lateritia]KAJ4498511.1 hypothetical protein C8R41DRAFT_818191 [Lentinula lateritia]
MCSYLRTTSPYRIPSLSASTIGQSMKSTRTFSSSNSNLKIFWGSSSVTSQAIRLRGSRHINKILISRHSGLRCMSNSRPESGPEKPTQEQLRHQATTEIIPEELRLIGKIRQKSAPMRGAFIMAWRLFKILLFSSTKDQDLSKSLKILQNSQTLADRTKKDFRSLMDFDDLLQGAVVKYCRNTSCNDEITIKGNVDPLLIAVRLHRLRKSMEEMQDLEKLVREQMKELVGEL